MTKGRTRIGKGSTKDTLRRAGIIAVVTLMGISASLPTASASDPDVTGIVYDDSGNPMSGVTVDVVNLDNSQSTQISTDGNGVYVVSIGALGGTTGTNVAVSISASLTFAGCLVPAQTTFATRVAPNQNMNLNWGNPPLGGATAPTTLSPGRTTSESIGGVVTMNGGLQTKRVQGNGNPWGNYDLHQDFRLKDDRTYAPGFGIRDYRFQMQVNYLGYYDSTCTFWAVAATDPANPPSNNGTVQYSDVWVQASAGNVYDTGTQQLQMNGLNAAKTGQGATDLLMKIEVQVFIDTCDPANAATCPGALDFTATRIYYVEP